MVLICIYYVCVCVCACVRYENVIAKIFFELPSFRESYLYFIMFKNIIH